MTIELTRCLVTGGAGFVGSMVLSRLNVEPRFKLRAALRRGCTELPENVEQVLVGDLEPNTNWGVALHNVGVVIHTAARVHVMNDDYDDPLFEFRRVNVEGTLNLAHQAASVGVKRFIFISSIKVNGELTLPGCAFSAEDIAAPVDPYAVSKQEAEQGLMEVAKKTGMDVVIIRPPLVYGPGVKANFLSMLRWLYKGVPLPFGLIYNKRSLVALDNLVDLIITCTTHPAAANQVFLVSDDEDLSTTDLLQRTANLLGKPSRLLPIPQWLLTRSLKILGKGDMAQRLCGSLQVDISKTKELLGWIPPVSVDEELRKTVEFFLCECHR